MPILSGFCILGYNFSDLHIHPTLDVVLHPFMYKHKLKVVKDFFFKPFSSLHVCTTKCSSPWVFAPDQDSIKIRYLCKYVLSFSNYIETIYIPSSIYEYKNKKKLLIVARYEHFCWYYLILKREGMLPSTFYFLHCPCVLPCPVHDLDS